VPVTKPAAAPEQDAIAREVESLKAKFHYASWFGAGSEHGSKLVRSWFGAVSELDPAKIWLAAN